MLTVASPRSNWVPSLRGPQKCAFPHLRFYPCCVLAWNLPLPLSAGLSLQGLLEFYSYLWCRRRISPHPSLLQKPGRERERERCGLSPVSCESQVLSPLDSTNEEPCWGLEGGGQGEARASPPFRFPFRGASCSSCVSSVARSGSRRVIPSFSGSPQSLPPPFVSPAWGRQFHPAICQSPDFLPVSRLALYFPHRREPSPCIQLLL